VAFVIAVGVNRFGNGKEIPLLGALMYWVLGLFAIIFTGLMVHSKKRKVNEQEDKNGKKN
jgi:hypothetical protein